MTAAPVVKHFTLVSNPYPNQLTESNAMTLPLVTERDFSIMGSLPTSDVPVVINHQKHYQLLVEIIETIFSCDLNSNVILRMQMPGGGRMPKLFLDERIFMIQNVVDEELKLAAKSKKTLVVLDDHIIRYPLEAGDNRLSIRIHNGNEIADALMSTLVELLENRHLELDGVE